jgi:hypothetical protein
MVDVKLFESTARNLNTAQWSARADHNHEHYPAHEHDHESEHDHDQDWREWERVGFVVLILLLDWLQLVRA